MIADSIRALGLKHVFAARVGFNIRPATLEFRRVMVNEQQHIFS